MSGLQMKYFVLKPAGNNKYAEASRKAMRAYSRHIASENPELSEELKSWADTEWVNTHPPELSLQIGINNMNALVKRIQAEEKAKTKQCSVIDCTNKATHTWSGHPTCDTCGSPNRMKCDIPRLISGA